MLKTKCPCCTKELYKNTTSCIKCGYRSEFEVFKSFLRAFRTVSSILLGFCAAGLVDLASISVNTNHLLITRNICVVSWIIAAILFLILLIHCEMLLVPKKYYNGLELDKQIERYLDKQCSKLIGGFIIAAILMGIGLISLSFYYMIWLGFLALGICFLGLCFFYFTIKNSPSKTL